MTHPLTDSVRRRLAEAGVAAETTDIYAGGGSRLYDELVGPDRSEVREVLAAARRSAGPILDLAAGSGRLTVPLVRSGHEVVALDASRDMLDRLRAALSGPDAVEVVMADMRSFDLGRSFGLVVLGATSVSLLDEPGRASLFRAVRRHLADGASFLLSVASPLAAASLARTHDRMLTVTTEAGTALYLQSQQVDAGRSERIVNWVRAAELAGPGPATVYTSRLQLVDEVRLIAELVAAGFEPPAIVPVISTGLAPGAGMHLLETHVAVGAGMSRAR